MIYDAVYLYALGMDAVLKHGGDPTDGRAIIGQLLHHSFQGLYTQFWKEKQMLQN